MALPDAKLDSAVAFGFTVKIDGVQIPSVISVSEISAEIEKVEYNQQTSDGKFVNRSLASLAKGGEFTVTRGVTADKAVSQWLMQVINGDLGAARKTAEVSINDYEGSPLRKYSFQNCWVTSLRTGQMEAGGTSVLTEEFTVSYDEMEVE